MTLDLPLQALRRRDPKNGLAVPPRLTLAERPRFPAPPALAARTSLRSRRRTFGNLATFFPDKGTAALSEWMGSQLGLADRTTSPGCANAGPANSSSRASSTPTTCAWRCAAGADAVIVSNHGGRQLDGATSTIAALAAHRRGVAGSMRGADGRRHHLRPGRAQGAGAGRARLPHRQELISTVWPRAAKLA